MSDELDGLPFRAQFNALYSSRRPRKIVCRLTNVFGREKGCDFYMGSSSVSRRHAILWHTGSCMMLADLQSRTGTRVNCRSVTAGEIRHKDELQLGRYRLTLNTESGQPTGESIPAEIEIGGLPSNRPAIRVAEPMVLCGSQADLDLRLRSSQVSAVHCIFVPTVWGVFVRDLFSRSGTFVNGKKVVEERLSGGDHVRIGKFDLTVTTIEPGSHRDQWPIVQEALANLQRRLSKKRGRGGESSDQLLLDDAIENPRMSMPKPRPRNDADPGVSSGLLAAQSSEVFDAPPDEVDLDDEEYPGGGSAKTSE